MLFPFTLLCLYDIVLSSNELFIVRILIGNTCVVALHTVSLVSICNLRSVEVEATYVIVKQPPVCQAIGTSNHTATSEAVSVCAALIIGKEST